MIQGTLNLDIAEVGANTGMLIAASHADRVREAWTHEALSMFHLYATLHPEGFMTEEVRVWASSMGFASPPDNRAWGFIAKKHLKDGLIESAGYGKQRSTTCHGSPKTIWKIKRNS